MFAFVTASSWLEVSAVIAELLCIWFLAKEKISTFVFGFLSGVLFFFLFLEQQLYGNMSIQLYFVTMNIIGFFAWRSAKTKNDGVHAVKKFEKKEWVITLAILLGGACTLNVCLTTWTDAKSTWLDSFLTMGAMIASFLTVKKYIENWLFWIALEIGYFVLFFTHELYVACAMAAVLTLLNTQGYVLWKKQRKNHT